MKSMITVIRSAPPAEKMLTKVVSKEPERKKLINLVSLKNWRRILGFVAAMNHINRQIVETNMIRRRVVLTTIGIFRKTKKEKDV